MKKQISKKVDIESKLKGDLELKEQILIKFSKDKKHQGKLFWFAYNPFHNSRIADKINLLILMI